MKSAWLALGFILLAPSAMAELTTSKKKGTCTLYEHRDLQGARLRMPSGDRVTFARGNVGSSAWREFADWNDAVSSAKIDAGCRLQVWEHAGAQGASKTWVGGTKGLNVNYVGSSWNDRVSSATCICD